MQKHYIVTGTYQRREDGKKLSVLSEHRVGVNNDGEPYNYLDVKHKEYIDVLFPVGALVVADITYVPESEQTQQKSGLKLGGKE